jgi:hypothetical protein
MDFRPGIRNLGSLAYHRIVAARLLDDPAILEAARQRVREWMNETPQRPYIKGMGKDPCGYCKIRG